MKGDFTMSNINLLLEAVGSLDNAVIENAFKPRRKKRIALTVIAAAAALSLVVGFAAVIRNGVYFENKRQISFNYYAQKTARIPAETEFMALGAEVDGHGGYTLDILPSELFALYNVSPLMNAEYFDEVTGAAVRSSNAAGTIIDYSLTDKESGKTVDITLHFTRNGEGSFAPNYTVLGDVNAQNTFTHFERITLLDGSEGFAADRYKNGFGTYTARAAFCKDGMGYELSVKDADITEMKEILESLGVK